ncbi:hypothetical protein FACS189430_04180 [Bacteroidia bacterium]|nr:hypothetical protein FACS189430_04180 [Bacteroidia bacterium]
MYRYKIKELIDWKMSEYRKPLIILGARQVGKTWLIEEFGRDDYATAEQGARILGNNEAAEMKKNINPSLILPINKIILKSQFR